MKDERAIYEKFLCDAKCKINKTPPEKYGAIRDLEIAKDHLSKLPNSSQRVIDINKAIEYVRSGKLQEACEFINKLW